MTASQLRVWGRKKLPAVSLREKGEQAENYRTARYQIKSLLITVGIMMESLSAGLANRYWQVGVMKVALCSLSTGLDPSNLIQTIERPISAPVAPPDSI